MSLQRLLANNRAWSARCTAADPRFFARLVGQQKPEFLWIGCSDSRVPANEIVGLAPGEVFVHRNIANVVVHTDLNCLSVLHFAVEVLRVRHIIVCGHYGCGGIEAASGERQFGLIDNWLLHVKDVRERHAAKLAAVVDDKARLDRLCELNVVEQARNVARTTIVQNAWERGQPLAVHGIVYALHDGLLRELGVELASLTDLENLDVSSKTAHGGGRHS